MSELPINWIEVRFLEIFDIQGGTQPPKSTFIYEPKENYVRLLQIRDFGDKPVPTYIFDIDSLKRCNEDDILIARYGASIGRILTGMSGAYNVAMAKVNIPVEINRRFTYHLLNSKVFQSPLSLISRSAQNGFNKDDLSEFKITIPPFNEQKRIADKLDSILARVDACRERLDRIPAILKRFRQAILAAATSGKLTEEWRVNKLTQQSDESNQMKTGRAVLNTVQVKKNEWVETNLNHNEVERVRRRLSKFSAELITQNNLPDNWCWAKLEDVSLFVVDCHNKTAPYEKTGIALVRTSNIRDGNFIWDDLRYVSEATYKYWSRRCYPEAGDVVFTREAPLGEAAIIPLDKKICLGQRTMLIRTVEEHYLAKFLLISLMDPKFKSRSEEVAVGTGVKHFRVGDVSDLIVPVPPTEEQIEIVRRVEELFAYADRIEARYHAARARVDKLTPAILAKAFRGELVPQNPDDEPASVLFDRIRTSRAANVATSKPERRRNRVAK